MTGRLATVVMGSVRPSESPRQARTIRGASGSRCFVGWCGPAPRGTLLPHCRSTPSFLVRQRMLFFLPRILLCGSITIGLVIFEYFFHTVFPLRNTLLILFGYIGCIYGCFPPRLVLCTLQSNLPNPCNIIGGKNRDNAPCEMITQPLATNC